jgi:hypothetical protein
MQFRKFLTFVIGTIRAIRQAFSLSAFSDLTYPRVIEHARSLCQTPVTVDVFRFERVTILLRPQLRNPLPFSIIIHLGSFERRTIGTGDSTVRDNSLHQ